MFVGKAASTPAACYAIARGFALSETDVRGATLLASLPISVASVALTERHRAPSDVVAANVCLGVACLLPVTLAWAALLDYAGADDPGWCSRRRDEEILSYFREYFRTYESSLLS